MNESGEEFSGDRFHHIYLQDYDGYKFEELCQKILVASGYGDATLTPKSGDVGKDIIIRTPHGNIFVECKHWPNDPIGRPLIQKLHSAIVSEGAISGIFITSGRYTNQAVEHAMGLTPTIRLIDGEELSGLAHDVGYDLIMGSKEDADLCYFFPALVPERIGRIVSDYIDRNIYSYSNKASSYCRFRYKMVYRPFYRLNYSKYADGLDPFQRNVSQSCCDAYGLIDGLTGEGRMDNLSKYCMKERKDLGIWNDEEARRFGYNFEPFRANVDDIREKAERHSEFIRIEDRQPLNHNPMKDMIRIYIPFYYVNISIGRYEFSLSFIYCDDLFFLNVPEYRCAVCGNHPRNRSIICSGCGSIICDPASTNIPHTVTCDRCHSIICNKCGFVETGGIGRLKHYCPSCARASAYRKMMKITP